MPPRIVVLNPNSTEAVTQGIGRSLAALAAEAGVQVDCLTLPEGPPGIETQAHIEAVIPPVLARLQDEPADARVIACFSDPGLALARDSLAEPVFGIAESAIRQALTLGQRFGILAILPASVPRHRRYVAALGQSARFADSRPLGLGVTELLDSGRTLARMVEVGETLRDQEGADVLIMGCAGMAQYRAQLAEAVGLPVVEPCQAAVADALAAISTQA